MSPEDQKIVDAIWGDEAPDVDKVSPIVGFKGY